MIQVIDRAMRIIELLGKNPGREIPVGELSDTLSLDKGTCTNILKTLASRGFVQQVSPRSGYQLGYALYRMTTGSVLNEELTKIAREEIENLSRRINETVLLSAIRNDRRIILHDTVPDRDLLVRTRDEKNVYSSNSGRVILANYTPAHLEKFIIRNGIPSPEEWPEIYNGNEPEKELRNIFTQIKIKGFSIQVDVNGIIGFAAPLFRDGHVCGSVATFLPLLRAENRDAILQAVLLTAGSINRKICQIQHIHEA